MLSHYPDQEESAARIYAQWKTIRGKVLKDPRCRSPSYEAALRPIRNILWAEGNEKDAAKIDVLLQGDMGLRVKIGDTKARYLDDEEMNDYLKEIPCLQDYIYDFKLPVRIVELAVSIASSRARQAQNHKLRARDTYSMTKAEFDAVHAKAKSILDETQQIDREKAFWDLAFALQIVSGRRLFEILVTLQYREGASDYQSRVTGIAKKQIEIAMNGGEETEYDIPLTVPYVLFETAMKLVRSYRSYEGINSVDFHDMTGHNVATAGSRCVGRRLTHTQKRNLYMEKVYRDREINKFHVGEESCSRSQWFSYALCHNDQTVGPTDRYASMTIEE